MQRQFGITLLAPGIGIKIVKKNNSLIEIERKERSVKSQKVAAHCAC